MSEIARIARNQHLAAEKLLVQKDIIESLTPSAFQLRHLRISSLHTCYYPLPKDIYFLTQSSVWL